MPSLPLPLFPHSPLSLSLSLSLSPCVQLMFILFIFTVAFGSCKLLVPVYHYLCMCVLVSFIDRLSYRCVRISTAYVYYTVMRPIQSTFQWYSMLSVQCSRIHSGNLFHYRSSVTQKPSEAQIFGLTFSASRSIYTCVWHMSVYRAVCACVHRSTCCVDACERVCVYVRTVSACFCIFTPLNLTPNRLPCYTIESPFYGRNI